jgi:hypothetical protein
MNSQITRRHALTGAIALAAAGLPRIATAKAIPADLQQLEILIAQWQVMHEANEIEGKACSALEERCQATEPPVPALLGDCSNTPLENLRDELHNSKLWLANLERAQLPCPKALAIQRARVEERRQRIKARKVHDTALAAHWHDFEARQAAWEAQIDVVDEALMAAVNFTVISPAALSRKAAFIASLHWFENGYRWEASHTAAQALVADIQRVAFGEG